MKKTVLMATTLGIALVSSAGAQQPGSKEVDDRVHQTLDGPALVRRLLQNEIQDLPSDHSALFAASRTVSIELEIPSTGDLVGMEDALVTVIRPNGEITEVRPDIGGLVTVDQVQEGPHAFVVMSERAHGAKLFYLDEASEQETESVPAARIPLADISGDQLRPFIDELRDVSGPLSDLKPSLQVGPDFGYRVVLEEDGTMRGNVLPLADRSDDVQLDGTRVAIFFRGIQVAETTSDGAGDFVIRGMRPGIHGLVAAGPEGYSAFAFEAVAANAEVVVGDASEHYVVNMRPPAENVPVVLIPAPMIPCLIKAMERYYGFNQELPLAGDPLGVPVGGFMVPSGGGGGGTGGLEGLATLLGIGAIAAISNDDSHSIQLPPTASPVQPGSF